jgi:hypothetical protein
MLSAACQASNREAEMAAIVSRRSARAAWLTGRADVRAPACGLVRRAMPFPAAAVVACAAGAALAGLAAQILGSPAPIAVVAGWNEVAS